MPNLALLLDLDNLKPKLQNLETICARYGEIMTRRAFANTPAVLAAYGGDFRKFKYHFEITPGLDIVSQEVDNLIAQTVLEIIANMQFQLKIIAIVSNDNGYAKLLHQLRQQKIQSLVIGNEQMGRKLRETADYVEILQETMRPSYLGIDLGTTNTVIARADLNQIRGDWRVSVVELPVRNEQGGLVSNKTIPSSVRFNSDQNAEVGAHVKAHAYPFRDKTILAWKHQMGCVNSSGDAYQYQLSFGKITPEMAAAKVLGFCRNQLQQRYGEMQGAVITHPASYETDAIAATKKAAVLAGWKEEEVVLIAEPQAALYDFLHRVEMGEIQAPFDVFQPSNILVYDLGGGTLDITLHQVHYDPSTRRFLIEDIAIGSRTRLGGDNIDELIVDYILNNSPSRAEYYSLSTPEQEKLRYELIIYAERFKKLWGAEYTFAPDSANFNYPFQGDFLNSTFLIRYYINVEKMRAILAPILCQDLSLDSLESLDQDNAFDLPPFTDRFNTLVVPVLEVFLKAKQSTGGFPNIQAVLLNGGMTYFPPIYERLQQFFGENVPILQDGNPDLAVARGAALYAAGALQPLELVNPTNIYLEVSENGEEGLRLLVAQGQKYPYKTRLDQFRIPNADQGYLMFKIWVGMGSKPGCNTTLQRLRRVSLAEIWQSNLTPGSHLELEVEYTFDRRLLLTLIGPGGEKFPLEVASEIEQVTIAEQSRDSLPIPSIPRNREGREINPELRVNLQKWEASAIHLSHNHNSAAFHRERKDLETQSAIAANRLQIIQNLLYWLERKSYAQTNLVNTQVWLAVIALSKIFNATDSQDHNVITLEKRFQTWIKSQLDNRLVGLPNDLLTAIAETPGKLFWSGFERSLRENYLFLKHRPIGVNLLNSFGKCAQPTGDNLNFLLDILRNSQHLVHQEKAAWAIARLISLGQPEDYRARFSDVERSTQIAVNSLYRQVRQPQIALNLLTCLCQYLGWQNQHLPLNPSLTRQIEQLPLADLPVKANLGQYPQIENVFYQRLQLFRGMLNIFHISTEELRDIQNWLLESLKD